MAEKNFEEGHCPECGAERADVVAQHEEAYNYDGISGATYYSVLECRGCGQGTENFTIMRRPYNARVAYSAVMVMLAANS